MGSSPPRNQHAGNSDERESIRQKGKSGSQGTYDYSADSRSDSARDIELHAIEGASRTSSRRMSSGTIAWEAGPPSAEPIPREKLIPRRIQGALSLR